MRRNDPDRYLSALFAPAERRPLLFVLYAFNHEIARIGETVQEPIAAAIRFEWWHETLESARDGRPRSHVVAQGLAEMFARAGPPLELFEPLFTARAFDSGTQAFAHLADLEIYGDQTAGTIMRVAAHLLAEHPSGDALFRHAGTAFALTGILRALPYHAARARRFLPQALAGVSGPHPALAIGKIVERAHAHYAAAHTMSVARRIMPAVLTTALVPLYTRKLIEMGDAALRNPVDVPQYRRQWAMLGAAMRGRV
ncbi:MAG TPA: squalene/phytoene synthase family protein [Rhizomicrobium sp.]|nr:squalene/phytoene synthase family protein [Rhizomicrobium sp.]